MQWTKHKSITAVFAISAAAAAAWFAFVSFDRAGIIPIITLIST